jgi:hypothetical protein
LEADLAAADLAESGYDCWPPMGADRHGPNWSGLSHAPGGAEYHLAGPVLHVVLPTSRAVREWIARAFDHLIGLVEYRRNRVRLE